MLLKRKPAKMILMDIYEITPITCRTIGVPGRREVMLQEQMPVELEPSQVCSIQKQLPVEMGAFQEFGVWKIIYPTGDVTVHDGEKEKLVTALNKAKLNVRILNWNNKPLGCTGELNDN